MWLLIYGRVMEAIGRRQTVEIHHREYDPYFDPPEEIPHPEPAQPIPPQPHFEFDKFSYGTTENRNG